MNGVRRVLARGRRPMPAVTADLASALVLTLLFSATACSGGTPVGQGQSPAAAASSARSTPGVSSKWDRSVRSGTPGASSSNGPSRVSPAVTLAEAGRELNAYLATDDVLRLARSAPVERWTLQLSRDGQRPIALAQLRSTGEKPPRYTWGQRRLLVPRQDAAADRGPVWFAATVQRRDPDGRSRTAVLTFVRQDRKADWQLSFASLLYPGERLPAVSLDADGYATALDSRDQTIAISPNLMGPLHATVAEEGPKGFASGLIAPGPQTTGFSGEINANKVRAKAKDCMNYESIFASAAGFPIFALRARDGGALILYTLIRTSTWSPDPGMKCAEGRPVAVPAGARWAITNPVIRDRRQIQETQQYVGAVPPRDSAAPADVIGFDGLVTKASTG